MKFYQKNVKFNQNQSIGKCGREREEVLEKERIRREGGKERVEEIKIRENGIEMQRKDWFREGREKVGRESNEDRE